ncbi:hypothetical protein DUNSADRAFT_11641 [Dunaliella salina]|uniref:Encoded protein n=1 Tax=Dunaliella salina TaxID=3046 RepID=A0ABZ3KTE3_DUNSA|nr:hypothetical protein DUNSADRAFT_11641 [Dunaliella salina]|eukprot:KAF5832441.1 hypothetical protein DUNSADRAFT_11641 [Dunaliella salina]
MLQNARRASRMGAAAPQTRQHRDTTLFVAFSQATLKCTHPPGQHMLQPDCRQEDWQGQQGKIESSDALSQATTTTNSYPDHNPSVPPVGLQAGGLAVPGFLPSDGIPSLQLLHRATTALNEAAGWTRQS